MKDLPHHMKKLNQKALKEARKEIIDLEEFEDEYQRPVTKKQKKKLLKQEKQKEKLNEKKHYHPINSEEHQKTFKRTVPILRKRSHHTVVNKK